MISTKTYPFELPKLPYMYDALEPYIDIETMYIHHDKHFQTYIDNLNKTLENHPKYQTWTLEQLLTNLSELPEDIRTSVRNNGGGVYNHDLYFDMMAKTGQTMPEELIQVFGSEQEFKNKMKEAALGQFGSGFAWLVMDNSQKLSIISLPNQDSPLSKGLTPILPLDVWEHAYYLKYQNLRGDYINNWFNVINWNRVKEKINMK